MTWLMAIVGVLVLGGVAMLAAGKATPMPPAFDDRPDARIPDGPITPETLRHVRFSLGFRGYRMSEVDELLGRLAAQLESYQTAPMSPASDVVTEEVVVAEPDVAHEEDITRPRANERVNPE